MKIEKTTKQDSFSHQKSFRTRTPRKGAANSLVQKAGRISGHILTLLSIVLLILSLMLGSVTAFEPSQYSFEPNQRHRIVTVGDLPVDHDPSLVLKKGRTVTIGMHHAIDSSEAPLKDSLFRPMEDFRPFSVDQDVYDDSKLYESIAYTRNGTLFLYYLKQEGRCM